MHTYMHTYIQTGMQTGIHTQANIHTSIHTDRTTYIQTCTYEQEFIGTYNERGAYIQAGRQTGWLTHWLAG